MKLFTSMTTSIKISAFAILILISGNSKAQKSQVGTVEKMREQYPKELAIFLNYHEEMDISVKGDSLRIKSTNYRETVHLNDQSSIYAKNQLYSSSFNKLGEVKAYTLVPNKNRFKKMAVTDFKETYDKNSSVFYDDTKVVNFVYPAVQANAHTVLEYDESITDPHFVGSFYFQSYLPIEHARFTLVVDKGINVKPQLHNTDSIDLKVSEKDLGNRTMYVYEAFRCKKFKHEDEAPNIKYTMPHLTFRITNYAGNSGKTINVLSSADDLYAWYKTFISDLKTRKSQQIQDIVDNLIESGDTEEDIVKKIFYWVQNNVKYIAFEDGMRGFIPHDGEYVCSKRYGDCKDMASIIVNMLHHAGVEAYFTWIGTRDLPYKYSEMPSPHVDNHMIATYIKDGKYFFLDATAQYSPFHLPSSMIQGKEALIAIDDSTYEIVTVPEVSREENIMADTSVFYINDGHVTGEGKTILTGYAKVFNSYKMIKSDQKKVKDYVTYLLARGSNKFFIDNYDIKYLDDLDKSITVDYNFRVEDYYRQIGDEIYFNLNLDKSFSGYLIDKDRTTAKENEYKYTNRSVSRLHLPDNFSVKYLPENSSYNSDVFGFSINYKQKDNQIIMEKEFYVDYLLLQPEQFKLWNDGIKNLSEAYRDAIVLKKIN